MAINGQTRTELSKSRSLSLKKLILALCKMENTLSCSRQASCLARAGSEPPSQAEERLGPLHHEDKVGTSAEGGKHIAGSRNQEGTASRTGWKWAQGKLPANYTYYCEKNASTQDENALSEAAQNGLFTGHQRGPGSCVTDGLGTWEGSALSTAGTAGQGHGYGFGTKGTRAGTHCCCSERNTRFSTQVFDWLNYDKHSLFFEGLLVSVLTRWDLCSAYITFQLPVEKSKFVLQVLAQHGQLVTPAAPALLAHERNRPQGMLAPGERGSLPAPFP